MEQDLEHIKILSIFHFVVAGLAGLFACFPILHLTIGISMLTGSFFAGGPSGNPFPFALFGLLFTIIPLALILSGWTFAICLAISGYFLAKQKHHLFCLVMAGICCMFMPFGTVLGVFTLVVLTRPSVKELFNPTPAVVPAAQPS
jgi:hypothetical protein